MGKLTGKIIWMPISKYRVMICFCSNYKDTLWVRKNSPYMDIIGFRNLTDTEYNDIDELIKSNEKYYFMLFKWK